MLRRFGLAVIALMVAGAISAARAEPASSPTAEATNPQPPKSDDASTPARDPNDVMFGYQSVEFGIDRDVIKIGRDVGKFNRIRLRVLGSDVHINDLKVSFEDGTEQHFTIDTDIQENTHCTGCRSTAAALSATSS